MANSESAGAILQVEIARAMTRATDQAFDGVTRQFEAFVRGMNFGDSTDMARVNRQIAADVGGAIVSAYETEVEAQRQVEPYSRPSRRSGYLGKVIRARDFVTGDAGGISVGDVSKLDKEAAHWRRMNFGAGEQAGPQPPAVPLRLFGSGVVDASLPFGPSRPFTLPKGYFIRGGVVSIPSSSFRGAGSQGAFLPSSTSPYRPAVTVGIRGRHFLEAGLQELSAQLPVRYADLLNEWIQRGGDRARAITGV